MSSNQPHHKPSPDTLPPVLLQNALLHMRLKRSALETVPFAEDIAQDIGLRLHPVKRDFPQALLLYPPCPLEDALKSSGKIGAITTLPWTQMSEDPDFLPLAPQSQDLIVTCLALQYANDLPGVLVQLRRALKPGGMLLGCLVGGQSLNELRESFAEAETVLTGGVTPRVHPHIDIKQMGALLQRTQFIEPIVDVEKYTFSYASVFDLLYDLRSWGGNLLHARMRRFTPPALMKKMASVYDSKFSAEGKAIAQIELIWFSAWVRDSSNANEL